MNNDSKLEEINENLKRLMQIQDFTTLQTTFLAILFALVIFSITALLTDTPPLVKFASVIILFLSSLVLYFLLLSILFNDWEMKLDNFSSVIMFITLISIFLIVEFSIFGLSLWLTQSFYVDNILTVLSWTIIFIIMLIVFIGYIHPQYLKRFNLLYKIISEKKKGRFLATIESIIDKRLGRFAYSVVISFFITFFTGIFERASASRDIKLYGFPFGWIEQKIGSNITEPLYLYLLLDLIVFTVIVYFIITAYEYFILKKVKKY